MVSWVNPNALFGAIVNENPSLGDSALLYYNNFSLGTETPLISNVNEFMKSGFINSFALALNSSGVLPHGPLRPNSIGEHSVTSNGINSWVPTFTVQLRVKSVSPCSTPPSGVNIPAVPVRKSNPFDCWPSVHDKLLSRNGLPTSSVSKL
jgi:hypothetical protein